MFIYPCCQHRTQKGRGGKEVLTIWANLVIVGYWKRSQSLRNFRVDISNNLLIASLNEESPYNNSWILFWGVQLIEIGV